MDQREYSNMITTMETKDGCPLKPQTMLKKTIDLTPSVNTCPSKLGLAVDDFDGVIAEDNVEHTLACSSISDTGNPNDMTGIIVTYTASVKLCISHMGGSLVADLPFKLLGVNPRARGKNPYFVKE